MVLRCVVKCWSNSSNCQRETEVVFQHTSPRLHLDAIPLFFILTNSCSFGLVEKSGVSPSVSPFDQPTPYLLQGILSSPCLVKVPNVETWSWVTILEMWQISHITAEAVGHPKMHSGKHIFASKHLYSNRSK